jgi:hypothetical protein
MFPLLKDAEFDDLSRTSESIASLPCELHSQLTLKHGETLNESGVAVLAHDPCSNECGQFCGEPGRSAVLPRAR